MPQTCTICHHAERGSIERGLLSGETFRHIDEMLPMLPEL